jgi:hypothetical protein
MQRTLNAEKGEFYYIRHDDPNVATSARSREQRTGYPVRTLVRDAVVHELAQESSEIGHGFTRRGPGDGSRAFAARGVALAVPFPSAPGTRSS